MNSMSSEQTRAPGLVIEAQRAFMVRVYGWMTLGLAVTALGAYYTATHETLLRVITSTPLLFPGLLIIELALVLALSAWIGKLTVTTARVGFIAYAALTGVTLSVLLLMYTVSSIASVFVISAGIFGMMAAYGYVTKRDLTSWRNLLLMGLLGLILASLANMFLGSGPLDLVLNVAGVFIFVGLTAYDTQRIKRMAVNLQGDEVVQRAAIIGALALYLDFINLFLRLLRLFGRRR
jgi:uncharacterized protein